MNMNSLLDALPHPVLTLNQKGEINDANSEAEIFFMTSIALLKRQKLSDIVPRQSPALALIDRVFNEGQSVNEYRIDISTPKIGTEKIVDIYASKIDNGLVLLMLQRRGLAEKIDRQLISRTAARSVTGLAAMLAHEIKNPLSGIKGAAQLLEMNANDDDKRYTQIIMEETDRIVKLVDKMEIFSDERPIFREEVNIHAVLEHCKMLAQAGFARNIRFIEDYDPSLPAVAGNRDQLVQVILNLLKNAAEALTHTQNPEIILTTAFRPGVKIQVSGSQERLKLPFEITIRDNGSGIDEDILPHLFDPFITTKVNGSGLGLALVAKLIKDHGGIIECESQRGKTIFRILLPLMNGVHI